MSAGILLTIGKYLFVALLYLFVVLVFRVLVVQAARAAQRPSGVRVPRVRRRVSPPPTQPVPAPATLAPEPESIPEDRVAADSAKVVMATSAGQVLNLRGEGDGPPVLVVQRSAETDLQAGRRYPLTSTVTIGRGSHNAIVLPDRYVSKNHAVIYQQDDRHLLSDQRATNGTYHNGTRIGEPVPLADGDEITIGTTVFTYQVEG